MINILTDKSPADGCGLLSAELSKKSYKYQANAGYVVGDDIGGASYTFDPNSTVGYPNNDPYNDYTAVTFTDGSRIDFTGVNSAWNYTNPNDTSKSVMFCEGGNYWDVTNWTAPSPLVVQTITSGAENLDFVQIILKSSGTISVDCEFNYNLIKTVGTELDKLANSAPNVPSMTQADFTAAYAAGTIKPGQMIYISDYQNPVDGSLGATAFIGADGTPIEYVTESELQSHRQTDLARWQQVQTLQTTVQELQAQISNKVLDPTQKVTIASNYVVKSTLGGLITYTTQSLLGLLSTPASISVAGPGGAQSWNSQGLGVLSGTITGSMNVSDGDSVTFTNMSTVTFTPYIAGATA
jgi:hypothetical protein